MLLNLQSYLLFQHLVLLIQHLVLLQKVTETQNYIRYARNAHVNSINAHIEDLLNYFSVCSLRCLRVLQKAYVFPIYKHSSEIRHTVINGRKVTVKLQLIKL